MQNLDRMIASCGSTLQELDDVTKKYRDIAAEDGKEDGENIEKKRKVFDDVARRMRVNWRKVRWDQEKQSLQQYREKLRSHADGINIILSSMIWCALACPKSLLISLLTIVPGQMLPQPNQIAIQTMRKPIRY